MSNSVSNVDSFAESMSSSLQAMTEEQRARLANVVEQYLIGLEQDEPLDADSLLQQHPDLAESLRLYFQSLNDLHGIAAGFRQTDRMPAPTYSDFDAHRIGEFRLVREIGRGGMGVVYEAHQLSLDRRVALKVLPFAAVLDAKQIARFKIEAQAAAQIQHPNIVPVYAIGVDRGVHYYAMQLIDGQPIHRAIEELRGRQWGGWRKEAESVQQSGSNEAPFDQAAVDTVIEDIGLPTHSSLLTRGTAHGSEYVQVVLKIGIQIAEALHAAHEYGVVHRDIKPSNLLIDRHGKVWVTDFGLARLPADSSLTRTGDVVGTMQYMSPEQATGQSAQVDLRTDIYSLGVTLYELLSLRSPFAKEGAEATRQRNLLDEPVPLRTLRRDIPADLETVVHKAMAKERDGRYATAQEFAEDLRRVLEGRPTIARPPTAFDRLWKWSRQRRGLVAAASAACFLAFAGIAMAAVIISQEKSRAEQNYQRAEHHFRQAQEAVDRFGLQLAEKLDNVPGASRVRLDLLRDTLRYYESFVQQAQDDPALREDLAAAYAKMGTLIEQIGSMEEAISFHSKAIKLLEQATQDPTGETLQRLGQCLNNRALALGRIGRVHEAQTDFAEAIRRQQKLVAKSPGQDEYLGDLARTYSNFGLLHSTIGNAAEAAATLNQAVMLHKELLARQQNNPEWHRSLAATFNNLASLDLGSRPERAVENYRAALEHESTAAALCPTNLSYRSQSALTLNNLGALQSRTGKFAEAVATYQQAINIQKELVRTAPAQKSYQHDLAVSYGNHGTALHRLRRLEEAEQSFRTATELHKPLVADDPDDLGIRGSLGAAWNNLGMVLEDLQRTDEAAEAFRQAIVHQQFAHQHAPDVPQYRDFLNKHYFNYGRVLREQRHFEESVKIALARRELWPNNPQRLESVAEELMLAAKLQSPQDAPFADRCFELVIQTLEQGVRAGLSQNRIKQNSSFTDLLQNDRFVKLINLK